MSKYRLDLKPSKYRVVISAIIYLVIIGSLFTWQSNVIQYQLVLQIAVAIMVFLFGLKSIANNGNQSLPAVIFSQDGSWLETINGEQLSWQLSPQSRASKLFLFINIVSPMNVKKSQWRLIYRDQVNEQDFRRLCRAIIFQQQSAARSL